MSGKTGLYFHWPFCLAKCPYCDFNVHVQEGVDQARWGQAYCASLTHYAETLNRPLITSVFFGGGTPSLMEPQTIEKILEHVHREFPCANNLEVTLEANPTSIENEKFAAFHQAGINRVSIGVQALNDQDLQFLGRKHSVQEAVQAIEIARKNFTRFSFDLIYARPNQTLENWEEELKRAVDLVGGHLSLYQLTIERSTPFYFDYVQKKFTMPGEDLAADFYHLTQDVLSASGLPAYEVSNHAAPGQESAHNLTYWHYDDYIGIGPGAHGRLTINGKKFATREHQAPEIWLQRVESSGSGAHPYTRLSADDRAAEALMMGLRLHEGLAFAHLEAQGERSWQDILDTGRLDELRAQNWLDYDAEHLWLHREGMLRLNAIIPYILKVRSQPRLLAR